MLNLPPQFKTTVSDDARIKYYSNNPFKHMLLERFYKQVFKMLDGMELRSIVEVGCGDGLAGYLIANQFPQTEYFGGDVKVSDLITTTRVLTKDVLLLDGRNLPFPDRSFDLSIFLEVFEHVKEWEKVLKEGIRVSRKALLLSVPAFPWYQLSNLAFGKNLSRWGEHHDHINQFPFRSLPDKIESIISSTELQKKMRKMETTFSFPYAIVKLNLEEQ